MGRDCHAIFDVNIPSNNPRFANLNAPWPGSIVMIMGHIIGVSTFSENHEIRCLSLDLTHITFASPLPVTVSSPLAGLCAIMIFAILYTNLAQAKQENGSGVWNEPMLKCWMKKRKIYWIHRQYSQHRRTMLITPIQHCLRILSIHLMIEVKQPSVYLTNERRRICRTYPHVH